MRIKRKAWTSLHLTVHPMQLSQTWRSVTHRARPLPKGHRHIFINKDLVAERIRHDCKTTNSGITPDGTIYFEQGNCRWSAWRCIFFSKAEISRYRLCKHMVEHLTDSSAITWYGRQLPSEHQNVPAAGLTWLHQVHQIPAAEKANHEAVNIEEIVPLFIYRSNLRLHVWFGIV